MALVVLTGGARSGKSRLAVDLARRAGRPVTMIATAEAGDEEMAERIRRHRAERPPEWTTVEQPVHLATALRGAAGGTLVIVDCLSLWAANLMARELPDADIDRLAATAAQLAADHLGGTIAVTNEVGAGVVPDSPIGRRYRDVLGRVNACWAAAADRAGLVVAGRLLRLDHADRLFSEDPGWIPN